MMSSNDICFKCKNTGIIIVQKYGYGDVNECSECVVKRCDVCAKFSDDLEAACAYYTDVRVVVYSASAKNKSIL